MNTIYTRYFFLFLFLIVTVGTFAQSVATVKTPSWVLQNDNIQNLPDSLLNNDVDRPYSQVLLYEELQNNAITGEVYRKKMHKVGPSFQSYSIDYYPLRRDNKLISVSKFKNGKEIDITHKLNWENKINNEYVNNKLWDSRVQETYIIDDVKEGDYFIITFLDTNKRSDIEYTDFFDNATSSSSYYSYIRVISDKKLNYKSINGHNEIVEKKNDNLYEYIAQGLWSVPDNDLNNYVPDYYLDQPIVMFTANQSIKDFGKKIMDLNTLTPESEMALDSVYTFLTKDVKSKEDKIKNIFNYVQDTLKYQDYGLYQIYQPEWCIKGRRGDCKAKTYIAKGLLKRMGIDSKPVLVRAPYYLDGLDDDIPYPIMFNHMILKYAYKGEDVLIDLTTSEQTDKINSYPIQSFRKGVVLNDDGGEVIGILPRHQGYRKVIDSIGSSIKREVMLSGDYAQQARTSYDLKNANIISDGIRFDYHTWSFDFDVDTFYERDDHSEEENKLTIVDHNTINEDLLVLKDQSPFSISKYNIFSYGSYMKGDLERKKSMLLARDTLYTGTWPAFYINEKTVSVIDKEQVKERLVLDSVSNDLNFKVEKDFGNYSLEIDDTDKYLVITQRIDFKGGEVSLEKYEEILDTLIEICEKREEFKNAFSSNYIESDNEYKPKLFYDPYRERMMHAFIYILQEEFKPLELILRFFY